MYRNTVSNTFKVWTLGEESSSDKELIQRFYEGVERFTPTLVIRNGSGFDLLVLHHRGLINGVTLERYWDQGDDDRDFMWNTYISRFPARHTDLMDILAGYQNHIFARLDEIAVLLGLPGKMGISGSKVWQ